MVILSGRFRMGTDDPDGFPADGEGPVREVTVRPFASDPCCVTNDRFAAFTGDTGYRTEAEQLGWSFVFAKFLPGALRRVSRRAPETPWWLAVDGACWRSPEGPGGDLAAAAATRWST
ncbi:MAG TPA: SUMF1/EgtB/PvdO family nonheme iron enzyme [Streptosporangiaceae bacterium]|nr:SUMF1/EgtB/PvdO family nonheme iron enzyme [Streptosporangiaceae bacterium]